MKSTILVYRNRFDGSCLAADGLRRNDFTVGRVPRTVFAQHNVLAASGRANSVGERRGAIDVLLDGPKPNM